MSKHFSLRHLLLPFVPVYRLGLAFRELQLRTSLAPTQRLQFPVVSVGNLSTGGAGKTPFTIALAQALTRRGVRVDVLSRGYGRQSRLPARVQLDGTAEDFGDEPLLIAQRTGVPVYVAAQRYQAGLLAEADPASAGAAHGQPQVHLLDDAFQHRQLYREVDILLLNRDDWAGSLLPAGNLREPLQAARRATVIAIPADEPDFEATLRAWGFQGPIWRVRRHMEIPAFDGPVVAFCGIARPRQFFQGLESAGLSLAAKFAFPDHHRYTATDLTRLKTAAGKAGATALATTEKDLVRLGKLSAAFPKSLPLKTARLRIEIEDEPAALTFLLNRLSECQAQA